jgi:hypothetical protein
VPEGQNCAYIEFEDRLDAEDAAKHLAGKKILNQPIQVAIATADNPTGLKGAAPSGLGFRTIDIQERIAEMAGRYRLDEAATARLASVFSERSRLGCDIGRDLSELGDHLAASSKPSALVSMKLADLRAGRPIGPCKYQGVRRPGAFEDQHDAQERRREHRRSRDSRERSHDRVRSRYGARERDRRRSREYDKAREDRDRKRDRARGRSASKSKEKCRKSRERQKESCEQERDKAKEKEKDKSADKAKNKKSKG